MLEHASPKAVENLEGRFFDLVQNCRTATQCDRVSILRDSVGMKVGVVASFDEGNTTVAFEILYRCMCHQTKLWRGGKSNVITESAQNSD